MATTTRPQKRPAQDDNGLPGHSGGALTREERPGAGTMLRHAREELGWDIYQVGDALRIRPEYLDSLERNSLDGLPGPAYAMGFLKTYADFLQLDTKEVVRRFKAEKSALTSKPELTFPVPLTDRGIPGGGLFLTALILIALGYGTWYYMSSGRHSTPMAVEQVPSQLLNPPPPEQQTAAAGQAQPSNAPGSGTATAPAAPSTPGATSSAVPPASGTAPPNMVSIGGSTAQPSPDTGNPATGASQNASPISPASPPSAPATAPSSEASTAARASAAADDDNAASDNSPHAYGQTAAGHVVVHATTDSWVQIKDNGHPIFTRVLKPGDSYNVPDRPGLVLRTGNAGGIEISRDGKTLPPLGAQGEVRGNVDLDPEKLTSTAVD